MSLQKQASIFKRRTSERRRIKQLQRSNQYRISNPFKSRFSDHNLPDELFRQLRKIDFLSLSSISLISFDKGISNQLQEQSMLEEMKSAQREQAQRYINKFMQSPITFEQKHEDEFSQQKQLAEEIIQTKDEISLNLYDPRECQRAELGCKTLLQIDLNLLESESRQVQENVSVAEQAEVVDQEFEQYFAN